MFTAIIITVLCILASVAMCLIIRLAVYGVDACIRYHRTRQNSWGSRSATTYSGEVTVDTLHEYYTYIGKKDIGSRDDISLDDCCSVCLEALKNSSNLVRLNACHHIFHRPCIDEWILAHPICPLCKIDVRSTSLPQNRQDGFERQSESLTITVLSSQERRESIISD